MLRTALLTAVLLAGCAQTVDEATDLAPRPVLLAEDVALNIRVDHRSDGRIADVIAAEVARLIGPDFDMARMSGFELILNMTGRVSWGQRNGRSTLAMDWDVRDQGGTAIALYRVAILANPTVGGSIGERDARGLAFYTAEALVQQEGIRQVVLARRAPQGG